jgi:hypothetical protein
MYSSGGFGRRKGDKAMTIKTRTQKDRQRFLDMFLRCIFCGKTSCGKINGLRRDRISGAMVYAHPHCARKARLDGRAVGTPWQEEQA